MTPIKPARFHGGKVGNAYAAELGDLYNAAPKAVLAAIAVSFATMGGDEIEQARARVLAEWLTLYRNGIVTQKPPVPASHPTEPMKEER